MLYPKFKTIAATALAFAVPSSTLAAENNAEILNLVSQTYGIEKLKTISIYSDLRFGWIGQGYTPGYVELPQMVKDLKVDLVNKLASEESWGGPLSNYNVRYFTTDEGIGNVDYSTKTYTIDAEDIYPNRFAGEIRSSDTWLAYELVNRPTESVLKETVTYLGMPHTVMTLSIPDWTPMDIFVNSKTGHITKLQRPSPYGMLRYQFSGFKKTSGVTYADNFEFYVGDFFSEYAKERRIKVNSVSASTWKIDRGMKPERKKLEKSTMKVEKVAENVHHVGKSPAYTTFIDAGSYIISVGNSSGFKQRWEAYAVEQNPQNKPLRFVVVTHHHADHLVGIKDGYDLGANIIVTEMAAQSAKDVIGNDLSKERIEIMGKTKTLGPVEIYDIATSHVGSYALVYVPASKTIIQVDHYDSDFIEGPASANRHSVSLKSEIDKLGLDVDTILSLHGRKIESWDNFLEAVTDYNPAPCPTGRPICR